MAATRQRSTHGSSVHCARCITRAALSGRIVLTSSSAANPRALSLDNIQHVGGCDGDAAARSVMRAGPIRTARRSMHWICWRGR